MIPQPLPNEIADETAAATAAAERQAAPESPMPAPPTKPLPPDEPRPKIEPPPSFFGPPPTQYGPPRHPGYTYGPSAPPPKRRGAPWYAWLIGAVLGGLLVLSLLVALVVGLIVGLTHITNGPEVTSTSTSSFTVSGTPAIVVNHVAGSITVVPGRSDQITIEVTKKARDASQSAAQNDLDRISIDLTQNGNTVNATATGDWHTSLNQQLTADLRITTPPTSNLNLTLRAGNITVNNITGKLTAMLDAGTLTATNVTLNAASQITVTAGEANVDATLTNAANLNMTVTTGTARLTLPRATSARLDARVNVGDISISGWPISVTRQNTRASASGDLNANPASTVTIRVTTGQIQFLAR